MRVFCSSESSQPTNYPPTSQPPLNRYGASGQLGHDCTCNEGNTPNKMGANLKPIDLGLAAPDGSAMEPVALASGAGHVCALMRPAANGGSNSGGGSGNITYASNRAVCWGYNAYGTCVDRGCLVRLPAA